MTLLGIDISECQPPLPWAAILDPKGTYPCGIATGGVHYAWIRATFGAHKTDSRFVQHWAEARGAGLARLGPYSFFCPEQPVEPQVDHLLGIAAQRLWTLPPMFDYEAFHGVSAANATEGAIEWCRCLHRKTGVRPLVYSYPGFLSQCPRDLVDVLALEGDLGIAHYVVDLQWRVHEFPATVPASWPRAVFRQHTGNLGPIDQRVPTPARARFRLPGCDVDVDRQLFEGTEADLDAWIAGQNDAHAPTDPAPPLHADEPMGGGTPDAGATPLRDEAEH